MIGDPFERIREFGDRDRGLIAADSHTAGQPTRVLLDGVPATAGRSAAEHRDALRAEHDWVRATAVLEPRGHRSMMGVALVAPTAMGGRWGLVFMDAYGYPDMCGHATIGVATTLVRLGLVETPGLDFSGDLDLGFDTPAGPVDGRVRLEGGRPVSVALQCPFAFSLEGVSIDSPAGMVTAQIAYGGQWFAFVPAAEFGVAVEPGQVDALIALAAEVREGVAERLAGVDPRTGVAPVVGNVVWWDEPVLPGADSRNMPVSTVGSFDRSPCGTATCARLAVLHRAGALAVGDGFVNEGVLGTRYRGRVVRELGVDGVDGIVAELEGVAHLTGWHRLVVESDDPLATGFAIGGGPPIGVDQRR